MIHVMIRLVDFMEATPVVNATVTVTAQVLPRWVAALSGSTLPYVLLDSSSGVDPFTPLQPQKILVPEWSLATEVTRAALSAADGTFRCDLDASTAFQRQRQQMKGGQEPADVVALLKVHILVDRLERTVFFYRGVTREQGGLDVQGENAEVQHTIAVGFAKTLVGHTAPNSTTLWFESHGALQQSDQCVCEIDRDETRLYAEVLTNALVVHFLRRYGASRQTVREGPRGLAPSKLRRTTAYIQEHLQQDLSLTALAAVVQMSPAHFARLFKQATGQTPHQYVLLCRIEHAKRLLTETALPLIEIGLQVGCTDQSYFTALFRKLVGTTPKAYRDATVR